MARFFYVSIVCLSFFASKAQLVPSPLEVAEAENRKAFMQHFSLPVPARAWELDSDTVASWKQWELVENFSFGKDRGNIPMIADLQSLHPYFRDQVLELIRLCRARGIGVAIVETYRTPTKQNEYKSMGRRYTRSRGGYSNHQYGLAVDIVPVIDSVAQWHNIKLWKKIGPIGERLGLRWGGRWRNLFDPGHFEWTGARGTYNLTQGRFPAIPKSSQYPCIDQDLKELQLYWKAWEAEQSSVARKEIYKEGIKLSASKDVGQGGND